MLWVSSWAHQEPPLPEIPTEPDVSAAAGPLLEVLEQYTGDDNIPALRAALERGEHGAIVALQHIVNDVRELVPRLRDTVDEWFRAKDFQAVRAQAPAIATLAEATGRHEEAAFVWCAAARGFWKAEDAWSTIAGYERAIAEIGRSDSDLSSLASVCHDNLGFALSSVDRVDDAIRHFRVAERLETDPLNKVEIRSHRADAYQRLGEYAAAASLQSKQVAELERLGAEPLRRAIALDNWASALAVAGEPERGLELNERAAELMPADALEARRINNSSRLNAYVNLGRYDAAAALFRETWELAVAVARNIDVEHFRNGYRRALDRLLPLGSEPWQHMFAGYQAQAGQQWETARRHLVTAARLAGDAGDHLTFLRAAANAAGVLADAQQVDQAWQECETVVRLAGSAGLALPIALAQITMASLLRGGSDRGIQIEALEYAARGIAYAECHAALVAGAELPPDHIERAPAVDLGVVKLQIGGAAMDAHAYDVAETFFREAVEEARRFSKRGSELNRMAGLLSALDAIPARRAEADALAEELRSSVDLPDTPLVNRLGILRSLGGRGDAARGAADLREAARLLETLRVGREPGSARSDLDRQYDVYPRLVRRLLEANAPAAESFAALQAMRARRLMEVLTARSAEPTPYQPPTVDEITALLGLQPRLTTFVDVAVSAAGLSAFLVDRNGLRTCQVAGEAADLLQDRFGDSATRARDAVALVLRSALLAKLARAVTDALEPGSTVLLSVDDALANLPLHAIPVGAAAWGDVVSLGRIPAAGLLRFTSPHRTASGRSVVAGDSVEDLPGARMECKEIGEFLGVRPITGSSCTREALTTALTLPDSAPLDVVHLAVHGRANPRRGGLSSLLFAGDPPEWTPFDELAALPWHAHLIVFSGCSTAVGGPRNGVGLYGVAQAAAEAGATTVIASLWPVDDDCAAEFMTTFFRELRARRGTGLVDLRELIDTARARLRATLGPGEHRGPARDGRNLIPVEDVAAITPADDAVEAAIRWAPFVVMGEPTLPV